MARSLAAFYGTRHLNGAAEKKKLFRERRFTGVRVGNNGESAACFDVAHKRRIGTRHVKRSNECEIRHLRARIQCSNRANEKLLILASLLGTYVPFEPPHDLSGKAKRNISLRIDLEWSRLPIF